MPREWPFGAPSPGSPGKCATADLPRVAADITEAFVDRAPIDWTSLAGRTTDAAARSVLENLRFLESIRQPYAVARPDSPPAWPAVCARAVLTLAAVQVACGICAIAVAAASGGPPAHRLSQVVMTLAFTAGSVLLAAAIPADRRSLFLLAAFACAASAFARGAIAGLPADRVAPIAIAFRGLFPEAFAPAAVWTFAAAFPHVRRFTNFDRFARRVAAAAWILGLALFAANLAEAYRLPGADAAARLGRDHPGNLFWHLFVLTAVPAMAAIFIRARRAPAAERRKVARLAMVLAAGTAPFLMSGLARMAVPGVDRWFRALGSPRRFWLDAMIVAGLTATPILSTIAVIADRAFERPSLWSSQWGWRWRARLTRGTIVVTVLAPVVACVLTLYHLRHLAIADAVTMSRAWIPVACVTAGCLLVLARRGIRRLSLDRTLRSVDRRQRLAAALERFRVARGEREVAAVLCDELRCGIEVDDAHLFVATGDGGFTDAAAEIPALPPDAALAVVLRELTYPLDLSDPAVRTLLPAKDNAWIGATGIHLAAGLKRRDGSLAAVAAVGPRRDAREFDRGDRWFVAGLTSAAAGAWDRESAPATGGNSAAARGSGEAAFECPVCGSVSGSTPLLCRCRRGAVLCALPHRLADKFLVERRLGAGGMGVVYLARDIALDRDVALKTLPMLRDGNVARLQREARAMASLNHEGLATIYGLEQWRRTPVLVVEYFADGTLARRLSDGPLSSATSIQLALRLAGALAYMHARGVLHRDLKPSNIGLTPAGTPKLLDFGLATLTDGLDSSPMAGTPAYLPPEAHGESLPDASYDLWALSIVLLEAVVGHHPLAAGRLDRTAIGSRALLAFFDRALAIPAEHRFHTAEELRHALVACQVQEKGPTRRAARSPDRA